MRTRAETSLTAPLVDVARIVQFAAGLNRIRQPGNVERLLAAEPEQFPGLARRQLQGQDAHADQVAAMDPLEARCDDRPDAQQEGPLAAQSRLLPDPYSVPARTTSGTPSALYFMAAS